MSRNQIARCPDCGGRISFKKFILLNNFSATNCEICNVRIEISNRDKNAILAGISGCLSAASIVMGAYMGEKNFQNWFGGFTAGVGFSALLLMCIGMYAYRNSELNKIYRN